LLLRRWLGRLGAVVASLLLLISPSILYYSRYIRNEIYIALWMMLLTAALFHFLEDRNPRWFYLGAGVLMLSLATKENAYFFGFIGLVYLLQVVVWERVVPQHRTWLNLGGGLLSLALLALASRLGPAAEGGSGGALLAALLTVGGGTLPAVLLSASLIRSRHPRPSRVEVVLRSLPRRAWWIALAILFLIYVLLFSTFFTKPTGLLTGIVGSLAYWLAQQGVERGGQPWFYYGLLLVMYEFLPLLIGLLAAAYYLLRSPLSRGDAQGRSEPGAVLLPSSQARFVSFLILWLFTSLFLYGWAGEKMPWMVVHQVLPLIVLSGTLAGDLLGGVDGRAVWQRGGARRAMYALGAAALALLALLTVRFAWLAAYVNYDQATELLVYAHGTPDVTRTMDEIAEISERTSGDKSIVVAYDQESTWPLIWYLREYPNARYYGDRPSRDLLKAPIVIASWEIDPRVRPYLGDRYHRFQRRELWWPNQQYMDLTWARIVEILTSPEKRRALWRILFFRDYPRSTDDWYYVDLMYVYIRKDVAQQLWDFGIGPPEAELAPDRYAERQVDLDLVQAWGRLGTAAGEFNHPRGIALGAEGRLYVADTDNHRIQVFDAQGAFLFQWGSQCNLQTGHGCRDPDGEGPLASGDGQFQEPWGLAVDPASGWVYVADTWNHRIQVFDGDGAYVAQWGQFGQVVEATDDPYLLWGPRDVVVDDRGRVLVSDTGNKRLLVFDRQGVALHQWGGGGIIPGHFEEPVGLALDGDGKVYVADTWNRRIQVFDRDYGFVREWPVEGWYGESVLNKPYLAVDAQGRVYVIDPEGHRMVVFNGQGQVVAVLSPYGLAQSAFNLPLGVAVDEAGQIYVADSDGQRIVKFKALSCP
jgi:uncharacterized protein (TIGR03663 family)